MYSRKVVYIGLAP